MKARLLSLKVCLSFGLIMSLLLSSCTENDFRTNENVKKSLNTSIKEENMIKFAIILSKAVYARKEVREFLKQESLKQFDMNYDVLYYLVKDEMIGNETLRDILISYSSVEELEKIEKGIPLLNIYVSRIEFFEVLPENLDTNDTEIPVIVSKKSENVLFFNGVEELSFEKGEVPNFHVFVVNENNRVILPENSFALKGRKTMMFKSPAFDGINNGDFKETRIEASSFEIGQKAIDAFTHFNKDDGSINQKAFQRDFIYYGITPQNRTGNINNSVTEYIKYLEINPNAYFNISDDRSPDIFNGDPYITNFLIERKSKTGYTDAELVDRIWSRGSYNFRFEIISSTVRENSTETSLIPPNVVYAPLRPEEIWNFNIDHSYRHSTWFRSAKHTYRIDPAKFTAKKFVFLNPINFGKWDISNESMVRYVKIFEEDEGEERTYVESHSMSFAHKTNFSGSQKISVGLKDVISAEQGVAGGVESSTTETFQRNITTKRNLGSDNLGQIKIYFYDPIVLDLSNSPSSVGIHSYNTGIVNMGIISN